MSKFNSCDVLEMMMFDINCTNVNYSLLKNIFSYTKTQNSPSAYLKAERIYQSICQPTKNIIG